MTEQNRIASLGYVRIGMRDPGEWASVGAEILGLCTELQPGGSIHLRMDSAPARFIVERAEQDGFLCAGWECSNADFPGLIAALSAHGMTLETGSPDECAARAVDAFVGGADASGNAFEVFHGRGSADSTFRSPIAGVEFVADDLGLGHLVLPAADHAVTSAFYQRVFGLGMSDELTLPPPVKGAPEMCIHFLHARSPPASQPGALQRPGALRRGAPHGGDDHPRCRGRLPGPGECGGIACYGDARAPRKRWHGVLLFSRARGHPPGSWLRRQAVRLGPFCPHQKHRGRPLGARLQLSGVSRR